MRFATIFDNFIITIKTVTVNIMTCFLHFNFHEVSRTKYSIKSSNKFVFDLIIYERSRFSRKFKFQKI